MDGSLTDLFRILVVVFLALHGIGHVVWFLGAWTALPIRFKDGSWILPGEVTIRSPLGKAWGLLALVAVVLFLAAAFALLGGEPTWRPRTSIGVIVSFVAVVPWLRQSPRSMATSAIVADLVLMLLVALPLSVELTGAG